MNCSCQTSLAPEPASRRYRCELQRDAPSAGWTVQPTDSPAAFGTAMTELGTPDQVARKLEQFRKEFVCTHLIMSTQLAGLDPKKGTASLELFAREIMPSLRNS